MYIGTTTVAAPAPMPDSSLPNASKVTDGARAESRPPSVKTTVVRRWGRTRPERVESGPAERAPRRPPRLNMEVTRPKSRVVRGRHVGRLEESRDLLKAWMRWRREEGEVVGVHRRAFSGALSSA